MDSLHNEIISLLEPVSFWALSSHSERIVPLIIENITKISELRISLKFDIPDKNNELELSVPLIFRTLHYSAEKSNVCVSS